MAVVRLHFSASEEITDFIRKYGQNSSDAIENLTYDYLSALSALSDEDLQAIGKGNEWLAKIEEHRKELELLQFKLERLFEKENNEDTCTAWFAIVEAKGATPSREMFEMGISTFFQFIPLMRNQPYTRQLMKERMTRAYCPEETYQLKQYCNHFAEADRIEVCTYQNNVREVFAYRQRKLIEYDYAVETIHINAYRRKLCKMTSKEWSQEEKEAGSSVYVFS